MRIIHNLDEMTETARGWLAGGAVGFIPTMGDLHEGHITLVQAARQECEISVASIFVNPLAFDLGEDLTPYARDLPRDLQLLSDTNADVVFIPRAEDLFPPHFSTYVALSGPIAERLESVNNPRYVRGLATEMTKLFQLVRPDRVYFGQKDAQEAAIVRKLVSDLNIDVSLRILPTVRESDGLAISSRNDALSPAERQTASIIYRALQAGKALIEQGERRPSVIEKAVTSLIVPEPLVTLDYVSVCHPDTLLALEDEVMPWTMLAIAVRIGNARFIDNIVWQGNGQWLM
jgi:pantoate--beta-alanine ligase